MLFMDPLGLAECKWVTTHVYSDNERTLVDGGERIVFELCGPVVSPNIVTLLPSFKPSRRLPFPVEPGSWQMMCKKFNLQTREPVYEVLSELWMSGFMECTDDCGEVTGYWSPDRKFGDFPNI